VPAPSHRAAGGRRKTWDVEGRVEDLVVGEDALARCAWGTSTPEYRAYHDTEWGRPVGDDDRVYEKLCLEGFQAGLSWLTILRKRSSFREAFARFDPAVVAAFGPDDVERLVTDARIVRHRAKISAAITNARATIAMRAQGESLAGLVWGRRPTEADAPTRLADVRPSTPESKALSSDLRRRGFVFVGPTTVYAAMQAVGVVNDHLDGCHWREITVRERARFSVPPRERR
jgi:DNA-3-methyladenine glycosylase I